MTAPAFIFGDCGVDEWPPAETDDDVDSEPWSSFVAARSAFARGATEEAERLWLAIASQVDIESRHVLQAWHFLRSVGAGPPNGIAKQVLGAVAEVAVEGSHEVLAAYADGSVRYFNFSGGATIIDTHIPTVDAPVQDLLGVAQSIVNDIGPWEGPLPELPAGHSRLTMLTPSGPHFGQGPDGDLQADATARTFFDAATRVLSAVVDLR